MQDLSIIARINKNYAKLGIQSISDLYKRNIAEVEEKIKAQQEKVPTPDYEFPNFALTRGANKATDLLNEPVHLQFYSDAKYPTQGEEDIILIYRVFFTLLKDEQLLSIKNKEEFWAKSCEYFKNIGDSLGICISKK